MNGTKRSLLHAVLGLGMLGAGVVEPLSAHEMGTLRLSAAQITTGSTLTLTGAQFTKSAPLRLELRGALETLQLGQVRTDGEGGFSLTLTLPPEARAGAYSLVVIADDGDVVARAGIAVLGTGAGQASGGAAESHATAEPMDLGAAPSPSQSALILSLLAVSLLVGALMVRSARDAEGEGGGPRAMKTILAGGAVLLALAGFAGARGPNGSEATREVPAADHVSPGSAAAGAASTDMAGMDHTGMAGMGPGAEQAGTSSATTGMSPMEHVGMAADPAAAHAGMTGMAAGAPQEQVPAMDHAAMPEMQTTTGQTRASGDPAMPGMDHGAMAAAGDRGVAAAPAADARATEKLLDLARMLLENPDVRARVENSAILRSRLQDPAVQEQLMGPSR